MKHSGVVKDIQDIVKRSSINDTKGSVSFFAWFHFVDGDSNAIKADRVFFSRAREIDPREKFNSFFF